MNQRQTIGIFDLLVTVKSALSLWMQSNLEYSIVELEGDLNEIETCLISEIEPPLNLAKYENYQKMHIQHLRNLCKEEAKQIWESNL